MSDLNKESKGEESPFAEFDRYCDRNNVPMEKSGEAFEAWLREYHELPDVKGQRIR